MSIRFAHANLISCDWKKLSRFYINVFGCVVVGPVRRLSGPDVSEGIGLPSAHIEGVHLKMPGCICGPTLEIFEYDKQREESVKFANSSGITHLAFEVSDLERVCADVILHGGSMLGRLSCIPVEGIGRCTFVYVRDPDRNIIEVQSWNNYEKDTGAV
ncbi:VOC family protein [Pseudomonas sp. NPDC089547]|uniref:VOC family protein n=1 Tax=Pseudomonas sp. NPDC089547 TaxID=3390652 RepID=UPI003CFFFC31